MSTSDAGVELGSDGVGADLAREVDLDGRIDRLLIQKLNANVLNENNFKISGKRRRQALIMGEIQKGRGWRGKGDHSRSPSKIL